MSYYNPKWLVYSSLLISISNAAIWPVYGLIYAKILFVMMNFKDSNADFYGQRDFWSGMFLLETFMIAIISFLNQLIFSYMGENLTYEVRNELF